MFFLCLRFWWKYSTAFSRSMRWWLEYCNWDAHGLWCCCIGTGSSASTSARTEQVEQVFNLSIQQQRLWKTVRCSLIRNRCARLEHKALDLSFFQDISIATLQVHYYSEALPTQHGYCVGVSWWHSIHRQLRVKDLPKVPTWRLDFNPRPFRRKALNLPVHHLCCCIVFID